MITGTPMTRQEWIKKWLYYGLLLLFTAFLQRRLFGRLQLLGVMPVLLPLAVMALASLEGAAGGAGFGVAAGALSTYLDGSSAWTVLLLCVCGLLTGLLAQHVLSRSFFGYVLCCLGAMLLREGWFTALYWYRDAVQPLVVLRVAGPELLCTMLVCPLIYVMFRFLYYRWGAGYYE